VQRGGRRFKDAVYEQFARIGKGLASPTRLELLDLLSQGEHVVEDLSRLTGETVANVSQHLQVLRRSRLVDCRKEGLYVRYRLAAPAVGEFMRGLRLLAEQQLDELERARRSLLASWREAEAVDRDELVRRVREGEAAVIDVRPVEEYRAAHLPKAMSLPLEELEERMAELPSDCEVVAYCRGPYCVLALEAVTLLRKRGYRAFRLDMGVWDWRARGLPVEGECAHAEGRNR